MNLVIKIDKKYYEQIMDAYNGKTDAKLNAVGLMIAHGKPLTDVIEDIKAEIEAECTTSNFYKWIGVDTVNQIIDRKVNSPKTLSSNGEYLESINRKVNEVTDENKV